MIHLERETKWKKFHQKYFFDVPSSRCFFTDHRPPIKQTNKWWLVARISNSLSFRHFNLKENT